MPKLLTPDFIYNNVYEITPEFLAEQGIDALILDIDNTLVPYEIAEPDEELLAWFDSLKANGISAALVSNNSHARVELFNRSLGLPFFPRSRKPSRTNLRRAIEAMGAVTERTAVIGDQIFTDVFAGKRLGIKAILVPPIKDRRDPFTAFKRLLERPIIRSFKRRNSEFEEAK